MRLGCWSLAFSLNLLFSNARRRKWTELLPAGVSAIPSCTLYTNQAVMSMWVARTCSQTLYLENLSFIIVRQLIIFHACLNMTTVSKKPQCERVLLQFACYGRFFYNVQGVTWCLILSFPYLWRWISLPWSYDTIWVSQRVEECKWDNLRVLIWWRPPNCK